VEDFKGLESDIVIFINHTYKNEATTEEIKSIQYTALTRARFYLYVIDYEVKPDSVNFISTFACCALTAFS
jgi:DNA helicase IV